MYSLYEDTVLDPFLGAGTTTFASLACGRNSVGIEIDGPFSSLILEQADSFLEIANVLVSTRIGDHRQFIASRMQSKGSMM
jgi:modification methylase